MRRQPYVDVGGVVYDCTANLDVLWAAACQTKLCKCGYGKTGKAGSTTCANHLPGSL